MADCWGNQCLFGLGVESCNQLHAPRCPSLSPRAYKQALGTYLFTLYYAKTRSHNSSNRKRYPAGPGSQIQCRVESCRKFGYFTSFLDGITDVFSQQGEISG